MARVSYKMIDDNNSRTDVDAIIEERGSLGVQFAAVKKRVATEQRLAAGAKASTRAETELERRTAAFDFEPSRHAEEHEKTTHEPRLVVGSQLDL